MATGLEIITDALAEIGAHDLGQSVPAEDAALALRYLNRMVQTWSNTRLMIPVLTEISVPLTGSGSYTIGPTGNVVAARPIEVDSAIATSGTTDYPVDVIPREMWDAIPDKTSTGGPPDRIWYDAASTNGRVYVYPVATGYTLKLRARTVLASFTLAGTITLPDGYESALVYSLAKNLAGAFGKPVSPDLNRKAGGAVSAIKRVNAEPVLLVPGLAASEGFQIERGY